MTHLRGPLLWTVAMNSTYLTKMAKELCQQQHLQLGLCLSPHLVSLTPHYYYFNFSIFNNPIFLFWVSSICPWTSTSSSCLWPSVRGSTGAVNGLFVCLFVILLWISMLCLSSTADLLFIGFVKVSIFFLLMMDFFWVLLYFQMLVIFGYMTLWILNYFLDMKGEWC